MSSDILDFDEQQQFGGAEKNVGFGIRLAAYLIDYFVMMIIQYLIIFLYLGDLDFYSMEPTAVMGVYPILFVINIGYFVGMWAYAEGATLGKKLVKIKIVKDDDGSDITIGSALLRYVGYIISAIPCLLGFLWVIWDKEKRGWHDKISNTKVVSTQ